MNPVDAASHVRTEVEIGSVTAELSPDTLERAVRDALARRSRLPVRDFEVTAVDQPSSPLPPVRQERAPAVLGELRLASRTPTRVAPHTRRPQQAHVQPLGRVEFPPRHNMVDRGRITETARPLDLTDVPVPPQHRGTHPAPPPGMSYGQR
jgi:hypothetical protein